MNPFTIFSNLDLPTWVKDMFFWLHSVSHITNHQYKCMDSSMAVYFCLEQMCFARVLWAHILKAVDK